MIKIHMHFWRISNCSVSVLVFLLLHLFYYSILLKKTALQASCDSGRIWQRTPPSEESRALKETRTSWYDCHGE
jgi:hypothetical protein